jgi:hypothetical protein
MIDPNLAVSVVTLVGLISGFLYTWVREGRTRRWQLADAKAMAEKVNADAKAVAEKLNVEAMKVAAKVNQESAETARQLVHDAETIAAKVHDSAEKLATKVAQTISVSAETASGAQKAYAEANSVNLKITRLQEQLLKIGEHIERSDQETKRQAQAIKDEMLFNQRVKDGIEQKLKELNGRK